MNLTANALFNWGTFLQICILLAFACIIAFTFVLRQLIKEMSTAMIARVFEMFPVWNRAAMYFGGVFIMSIGDKICGILNNDQWPSGPKWTGACIIGLGAGLLAMRAYNDGSAQRLTDQIDAKKRNGHDTAFLTKPTPGLPPQPGAATMPTGTQGA